MRIAVISDVHGNLPALEAVLGEVARVGVEEIVVGGDVLPGPMPLECLAHLDACPWVVRGLRGNGEADTLTAAEGGELARVPAPFREAVAWGAAAIGPAGVAAVRAWPAALERDVAVMGRVLFCHATPRSDIEIFTRLTPEGRIGPAFADVPAQVVVCGHTHMPFDRTIAGRRVVNPGSVGMPFGAPGAYWLLVDEDGLHLMRTSYDLEEAARRIRQTAYPGADAFAAYHVLAPPSEEAMLAAFEPR